MKEATFTLISTKDIAKGVLKKDKIYYLNGNLYIVVSDVYQSSILKKFKIDDTNTGYKVLDRYFVNLIQIKIEEKINKTTGAIKNTYDFINIITLTNEAKEMLCEDEMYEDLKLFLAQEDTKNKILSFIDFRKDIQSSKILKDLLKIFGNNKDELNLDSNNNLITNKIKRNDYYFRTFYYTFDVYPQIKVNNAKEYYEQFYSKLLTFEAFKQGAIGFSGSSYYKIIDFKYVPKIYSEDYNKNILSKTSLLNSICSSISCNSGASESVSKRYKFETNSFKTTDQIEQMFYILCYSILDGNVHGFLLTQEGINTLLKKPLEWKLVKENIKHALSNYTFEYKTYDVFYDKKTHKIVSDKDIGSNFIEFYEQFLFSLGTNNKDELEENMQVFSYQQNLDEFIDKRLLSFR